MPDAYAFKDETTLDTVIDIAYQHSLQLNALPLSDDGLIIIYAEILTLIEDTDGKEGTGIQRVFDATLNEFTAPDGDPFIWDKVNISDDRTTGNIHLDVALEVGRVYRILLYPDKTGVAQWLAESGGGGGSLVYATSPNTQLDAAFTLGATFPFPGDTVANATALDAGTFYLSTPWNTRFVAPIRQFGLWSKKDNDYTIAIDDFYIKPSANYAAGAGVGITSFTCYYNNVATFSLGTNSAFPSGVKTLRDGFDSANASTNSLNYFNGKIFPCTYDAANNIIYMDLLGF